MVKQVGNILFMERSCAVKRGPTCIDLFSGAGGFAEGLRQAGWSVLSGTDIDAGAGDTFRLNFPEASFFEGAISDVDPQALLDDAALVPGELDCLVGGPPCQSFSYNNHQRSASDARAQLFRDYLRIVKMLHPKTLVMENVPGMLTINGGGIIKEIQTSLSELGYECDIRILYAEDYGVPQMRRRAFIIASRIGDIDGLFPIGTHGPSEKPSEKANPFIHRWESPQGVYLKPLVTVWEAIGDLPTLKCGTKTKSATYRKKPKSEFQQIVRADSEMLQNHACHNLSELMLERIKHVPEGGNWMNIPRELLTPGMRRAEQNCHTKRYGRLSRRGLAATLLTKCDPHWGAYIHPTQNRTISVREAARLQGFPDTFLFAGSSIIKHFTQIGNAVPIPVAKALGISLKTHVKESMCTGNQTLKAAA